MLGQYRYIDQWDELYKAIAAYKNDQTLALLQLPLAKPKDEPVREDHLKGVLEAVKDLQYAGYDDLLWKLWKEERRTTAAIFDYLLGKYPDKTFEQAKAGLLANESYYSYDRLFRIVDGFSAQEMDDKMLALVLRQNSPLGTHIIRQKISMAGEQQFGVIARRAAIVKDTSFVEPLFNRLAVEKEPMFVYR